MRLHQVLAFAGAAVLSVSAFADPSIPPAQADSTVAVQGKMQAAERLTRDEAGFMRGSFLLDDGRRLVLSTSRSRLFAELDGKREELLSLGDNRFVARDSGTRVAFDHVPFANEVLVSVGR